MLTSILKLHAIIEVNVMFLILKAFALVLILDSLVIASGKT